MASKGKGWFGHSKDHSRVGRMGGRPKKDEKSYQQLRKPSSKKRAKSSKIGIVDIISGESGL